MEIEDLKRDSARLTWLIEEALAGRQHLDATVKREYARQYIDLMMVQGNAAMQVYDVFMDEEASILGHAPGPDRNIDVDEARRVK